MKLPARLLKSVSFLFFFVCLSTCGRRELSDEYMPLVRLCGRVDGARSTSTFTSEPAVALRLHGRGGEALAGASAASVKVRILSKSAEIPASLTEKGCLILSASLEARVAQFLQTSDDSVASVEIPPAVSTAPGEGEAPSAANVRAIVLGTDRRAEPRLTCPEGGIFTSGKLHVPFAVDETANKRGYTLVVNVRRDADKREVNRTVWKRPFDARVPALREKWINLLEEGQFHVTSVVTDVFGRVLVRQEDVNACPVHVLKSRPFVVESAVFASGEILLPPGEPLAIEASQGSTLFTCVSSKEEIAKACTGEASFSPATGLRFSPGAHQVRAFARDPAGNTSVQWERTVRVAGVKPRLSVRWVLPKVSAGITVLNEPRMNFSAQVEVDDPGIPRAALEDALRCKVELRSDTVVESSAGATCSDDKCMGEDMGIWVPCSTKPSFVVVSDGSSHFDRALVLRVRLKTPLGTEVEQETALRMHSDTFAYPRRDKPSEEPTDDIIFSLLEGASGEVYAVSRKGVRLRAAGQNEWESEWDDDGGSDTNVATWTDLPPPADSDYRLGWLVRAFLARDGKSVWVLHDGGISNVTPAGVWTTSWHEDLGCYGPCRMGFEDASGAVWVFGPTKAARLLNGTWTSISFEGVDANTRVAFPYEAQGGALRVLTTQGRFEHRGDRFVALPFVASDMKFSDASDVNVLLHDGAAVFRAENEKFERFVFSADEHWRRVKVDRHKAYNRMGEDIVATDAAGDTFIFSPGSLFVDRAEGTSLGYTGKAFLKVHPDAESLRATALLVRRKGRPLLALRADSTYSAGHIEIVRVPKPVRAQEAVFSGVTVGGIPDFLLDFHLSSQGTPWLLSPWGYALSRIEAAGAVRFRTEVGELPFKHIYGFSFKDDALAWVVGNESLFYGLAKLRLARATPSGWVEYPGVGEALNIRPDSSFGSVKLFMGPAGETWLVTPTNGSARFVGETWETWPAAADGNGFQGAAGRKAFCVAQDGAAWAVDAKGALWRNAAAQWQRQADVAGGPFKEVACDRATSRVLALGTGPQRTAALFLYDGKSWREMNPPFEDALPDHVGQRDEGGFWALANDGAVAWEAGEGRWSRLRYTPASRPDYVTKEDAFFARMQGKYFWFTSKSGLVRVELP